MRVFVTGASGHIGCPLVAELVGAGHQVLGLARSDESANRVAAQGGEVVRGDMADLDLLRNTAAAADAVVHLAFRHDLMAAGDRDAAASADLAALRAIAGALIGTGKPLVGPGGTLMLVPLGRVGTEADILPGGYRIDAENYVAGLADRGVRSSVVRLSPVVHSSLDLHGFIPGLIAIARRQGFAAYVGDGANRWPAVHTLDAARLYRLAVEVAPPGARLHGASDGGIPFRQIAEHIGKGLGLPVRSLSPEDAPEYFGYLASLVQLDGPVTSARTRQLLDWEPTHPGLLPDLDEGHYFRS